MSQLNTIVSMLHQSPSGGLPRNSAQRAFRDAPVLDWTLQRLTLCPAVATLTVLCWEDQLPEVQPLADARGAYVLAKGPRVDLPALAAVAAARRWEGGWRGRLMGACDFDLGFHRPWIDEIYDKLGGDLVMLVDPAAALIDPHLVGAMVEHARQHAHLEMCFSNAAPGLAPVLLRWAMLREALAAHGHPGALLQYVPDHPFVDPTHLPQCAPTPATLARCTHRFKIDSDRQLRRIERATEPLNGELMHTPAEALAARIAAVNEPDALPRDVTVELTLRRQTSPPWLPTRALKIDRPDATVESLMPLLDELGGCDDARITLAGVGDPLLAEACWPLIAAARQRGISICLETDLVAASAGELKQIADSGIDVLCVNVPAASAETYRAIMGIDALGEVLESVKELADLRRQRRSGTPLIVPVFYACGQNLGEMELWYDQWLRAMGHAVIRYPSDCAGQIADCAPADLSPPKRVPCRRLMSRAHVLCDGRVTTCDQDVLGVQTVGKIASQRLGELWNTALASVRQGHQRGEWPRWALCAGCRHWDRP